MKSFPEFWSKPSPTKYCDLYQILISISNREMDW